MNLVLLSSALVILMSEVIILVTLIHFLFSVSQVHAEIVSLCLIASYVAQLTIRSFSKGETKDDHKS